MRSLTALVTVAGLATSGCGTDQVSTGPATFTAIYAMIFPRATRYQCEFCHGLPANDISNGNLSMGMDKPSAYAALVGQPSTGSMCPGMELVVPGDPDHSLFYLKLTAHPPCGDRMPLAGAGLSSGQLLMVRTWILNGAQDD